MATIVLLNGVGSVGKSSIAKALQTLTRAPFLHVRMDSFLDMMPLHLWDHPHGFVFEAEQQVGKPSVAIRTGPVGARIMRGMRRAIAAMAGEGNNLIIDDVLVEDEMADYAALLAPFTLRTVGVFAPLDVLEARERSRGDRMIGLARWQFDRVHQGKRYDLEVDASKATPLECAETIKRAFDL